MIHAWCALLWAYRRRRPSVLPLARAWQWLWGVQPEELFQTFEYRRAHLLREAEAIVREACDG